MPPAISDDESSGSEVPDDIPAKAAPKGKAKAVAAPVEEPEPEEDEDESERGDDEYVVEKILAHAVERKKVRYQVKWLGYDEDSDLTWEPAENLDSAPDKLEEYHASIGGPPNVSGSAKQKKGAKRSASDALDSPAPTSSRKKGRKSEANGDEEEMVLPKGTWENDISNIMSIIEETTLDDKKGRMQLMAFVQWRNGRKSKHPLSTLRTKAPQHLLTYYENHLRFGGD